MLTLGPNNLEIPISVTRTSEKSLPALPFPLKKQTGVLTSRIGILASRVGVLASRTVLLAVYCFIVVSATLAILSFFFSLLVVSFFADSGLSGILFCLIVLVTTGLVNVALCFVELPSATRLRFPTLSEL